MNQPHDDERMTQPMAPYWAAPQADDEIDLFELWDILWAGKWLIIAVTAISALASVAYALLAEEVYQAQVVMVPAEDSSGGGLSSLAGQFGGLASLAGVDLGGGGGGKTDEALQVLQSFAFLSAFIQEHQLLPILFETFADSTDDAPSLQTAVKHFQQNILSVSQDKNTAATRVSIQWTDADSAARWANALVSRVNEVMREQDVAESRRSVAFLEEKLTETNVVEMRETIYRLIEAQTKTIMLANVRDDYVFRVIDPAYPPEKRAKPKRALICVLGTMLGGFLGVLMVFARRVVDSYHAREKQSDGIDPT